MVILRGAVAVFLMVVLALAAPFAYAQDNATTIESSDDELVLLSLRIGRTQLVDGLPGYTTQSGLLLPLGQLSEILQLPIKTIPQEGQASGWIQREDNQFSLDVARHEVIVGGKRSNFSPEQVQKQDDDIYIDTSLLKEWLQIDFEFSFATQSVTLVPREGMKLPIQLRTEREQARQGIGRSDSRAQGPFARKEIPYELATVPYTDFSYTGGYDKRVYSGLHNSATALAQGDLLYMHSNIYASVADSSDISDFRLTLSRRDPEGKILQSDDRLKYTKLGELLDRNEIREVQFGDISTGQLPLTAFNQQGRGALISNIPYDRATQFDRTSIQGDLQAGWEVELYRNDELLSFQRSSANGRYEFIDVPLLSGVNIIRLVFYGPFGQTREEVQRYLVSDDLTQKGKSYFRASMSQQNTNLFDVLNQNQITSLSGNTPTQLEAIKGKPRAMFEYEYGLLDNLSLFTSASHLTTPDNVDRNYVTAGAATTIAGAYSRVDVARDIAEGGNAVKLLVQDNWGGVSVSAEHQHYFDFISEFTESGNDSITRRTTARADAPLTIPYLPRLNNGVTFTETAYDSDRMTDELTYRLSTVVDRLAISHNLTYLTDTAPAPITLIGIGGLPVTYINKNEETRGELIVSVPYSNMIFRGNMLYGISPDTNIQTLIAAMEYNFTLRTNSIFQIDHQFINDRITNYTLALNHTFDHFRLGGNIGHASDGENTLGMTLSLSFGEDPRTGKFQFYPDYSASNGLISARAYHDVNGNNIFDEGDKPVENARFLVNNGTAQQRTDASGSVLLRNINPDTRSSLTVDSKSLENPFLMNTQEGVDVVTRPGVAAIVDYPLTGSGDIEGTIRILSLEEDTKDATNVTMQLFNAQGKLVRETQTSFDGYYLLNGVPAGQYTLRPSHDQAARLGLITPPDRIITISNSETDSHIIDMEIIREPEEYSREVTVPAA